MTIINKEIDSILTVMPRLDAETQGRVFAIFAIATDRIKWMAQNRTGIPDSYKVERINEIIKEVENDLGEVLK